MLSMLLLTDTGVIEPHKIGEYSTSWLCDSGYMTIKMFTHLSKLTELYTTKKKPKKQKKTGENSEKNQGFVFSWLQVLVPCKRNWKLELKCDLFGKDIADRNQGVPQRNGLGLNIKIFWMNVYVLSENYKWFKECIYHFYDSLL